MFTRFLSRARSLAHLPLPFLVLLTKTKSFFFLPSKNGTLQLIATSNIRLKNLRSCSYNNNNNAFISRQTFLVVVHELAREEKKITC